MRNKLFAGAILLCLCCGLTPPVFAQGTAFTYQGQLSNGGLPVSGNYDLQFTIYNTTNIPGTIIAGPLINAAIVVSNGLFSTTLDFGAGVFTGADRWLEIGVSPAGGGTFVTLSPRQKLAATPYAITAGNLTGGLPAAQLNGTVTAAQVGSFTNHSDVVINALAPGHAIIFGGSVWTNGSLPSGGGPTASNGIPVLLSYSGTNVPVDASLGTHFRLVATNSFLLQTPTGASEAQRMVFEIIQDSTGGRTMTLGNGFKLGTDLSMINLTTNANRRDFLTCICSGGNFYVVGLVKGY